MQQWEYLEVQTSGANWRDSAGHAGVLPYTDIGGGAEPSVGELIDDLGAQGWHVTEVEYGAAWNDHTTKIYLKRPVSNLTLTDGPIRPSLTQLAPDAAEGTSGG